jgi:hypothetical protein
MVQPLKELAVTGLDSQMNPAIDIAARGVSGEANKGAIFIRWNKQAGANQGLETIADSQNEVAAVAEGPELVGEKVSKLSCPKCPCACIIPVREATWHYQDLVIAEDVRALAYF